MRRSKRRSAPPSIPTTTRPPARRWPCRRALGGGRPGGQGAWPAGLRVIDASIFPDAISVATNITTIAVAEHRAAHRLTDPGELADERTRQTLDRRRMARFRAAGQSFDPASASRSAPTPTAGGPRPMRRSPPLCAPSKMVPEGRPHAARDSPGGNRRGLRAACRCAHRPLALENGKIKPEAAFEVGMVPGKLRTTPAWRAANGRQRHAAPRCGVAGAARADGRRRHHRAVEFTGGADDPLPAPALAAGTTTVVKMPADRADQRHGRADHRRSAVATAGAVNIFSESVPKAPGD